ncbi:hypothetical protein IAT38_002118 [Cryptococcus sp. DSM 104549]
MPWAAYPDDLNLSKQSAEVPGTRGKEETGVWQNAIFNRRAVLEDPREPKTMLEMFEQSVALEPDRPLFLSRTLAPDSTVFAPTYTTTLRPTTYKEAALRRNAIGSALLSLERTGRLRSNRTPGPSPAEVTHPGVPYYGSNNRDKHGARRGWAVGIWSKNREEWQITDLACQAYGLVGVSFYETLGPDVAQYITNHCPLSIVFASANHLSTLIKVAPKCPTLRIIVSMDPLPAEQRSILSQWAASVDLELLEYQELERMGAQPDVRCEPGPVRGVLGEEALDKARVITISYTSGTTGDPKGVVLTNDNLLAAVQGAIRGSNMSMLAGLWRYFAFLPLAHCYERLAEMMIMAGQGTICYGTGDPLKFFEDIQLIQPHQVAAVPRIWNRVGAAIEAQMEAPGLKGALLKKAVNTKLATYRETGVVTHPVYDLLVFRKIRALMGGHLMSCTTGSAPLGGKTLDLLKVSLCCDVVQGYGLTETVAVTSKTIARDPAASSTTGPVHIFADVKLRDIPDMGYTSQDKPNPRGEICIRGRNISPGYLHDPIKTAEVFTPDGWFFSGDVGEIDSAGRLSIVDRVKNLIKLSQGEYVAIERLESIYTRDPIFASLFVHGDSSQSCLVAIGIVDPANVGSLIEKVLGRRIAVEDVAGMEAALNTEVVRKAVLKRFDQRAREEKLNGFERIKEVHLFATPFDPSVLTPTFKLKRKSAGEFYRKEIDAAYARIAQEAPQLKL